MQHKIETIFMPCERCDAAKKIPGITAREVRYCMKCAVPI